MKKTRRTEASARRGGAATAAPRDGDQAIQEHRIQIEAIDEQLVKLLNERAGWAISVGGVKKKLGLPVYSAERESQILARVCALNQGPLEEAAMRRLFERIIDESRRIERLAVQEKE